MVPVEKGNIRWSVPEFSERDGEFFSPVHEIGDKIKTKWQLELRRQMDCVSVFVKLIGESKVRANVNLEMRAFCGSDNVVFKRFKLDEAVFNINNPSSGLPMNSNGWYNFTNMAAVERACRPGSVYFICNVEVLSVSVKKEIITQVKSNHFGTRLCEMMSNKEFTDVELRVKGEIIACHKVILSGKSKVFKAMFTNTEMIESQTNSVNIDHFSYDCMVFFVDYIYKNMFDVAMKDRLCGDIKLACEVYTAADFFDVPELKAECSTLLKENLNAENVFDILKVTSKHSNLDLIYECLKVLHENPDLVKSQVYRDIIGNSDLVLSVPEVLQMYSMFSK